MERRPALAQRGTEAQRQKGGRVIIGERMTEYGSDRTGRRRRGGDAMPQMSRKEADLAGLPLIRLVRRQLVVQLEPAEPQQRGCQQQMQRISQRLSAGVHQPGILGQRPGTIKPRSSRDPRH